MKTAPLGHYRPRLGFGMKCRACCAEFHASRKDAQFCGARCRKAWQRLQERLGKEFGSERENAKEV